MHLFLLSLAVSTGIFHQATAFTYWIDGSCSGDKDLKAGPNSIIDEVKYMGAAAHRRMNSGTDSDFRNVYEYAMKNVMDPQNAVFQALSSKNTFLFILTAHALVY